MKKIVATCLMSLLFLVGCTNTDTTSTQGLDTSEPTASESADTNSSTTPSTSASSEAKETDSAVIKLSDGSQVRVFINEIILTEERIDGDENDPDQVIMIDFGYENISSQEDVILDKNMFRVYDENNALATLYNLESSRNYGYIKKGTTLEHADLFYSLANASSYVTVDFRYSGETTGQPDASFVIKVQ